MKIMNRKNEFNIFRCTNIEHTALKLENGKCELCGKDLEDKWLPFVSSEKVSVKVCTLHTKDEIGFEPIENVEEGNVYNTTITLLKRDIDESPPFLDLAFINVNKIKNKIPNSRIFNKRASYKTNYEDWQKRYFNNIESYNQQLFDMIKNIIPIKEIDVIILPETKAPELRQGIEDRFINEKKIGIVIASKLDPKEKATGSENHTIKFHDFTDDLQGKKILILDECISSFKTVFGIIESCAKVIDIKSEFIVGAYYYDK